MRQSCVAARNPVAAKLSGFLSARVGANNGCPACLDRGAAKGRQLRPASILSMPLSRRDLNIAKTLVKEVDHHLLREQILQRSVPKYQPIDQFAPLLL
jgi:hypothetical protein